MGSSVLRTSGRPLFPALCSFMAGHFPTGSPPPCTLTISTFIFGDVEPGVQDWGWDRGVRINANHTRQFVSMSSACDNPGRIHLLDPGTSLIAYSSHQQCTNTVIMTISTTRENDHKAQEALGCFLLLLFCWPLREDDAVWVCRPSLFLCLWLWSWWPEAHASLNSALPVAYWRIL